jgi:hypothetical protein
MRRFHILYTVKVVDNHTKAASAVTQFMQDGFIKEDIYVFAHDKDESQQVTDATNTSNIGFKEQGLYESIGNIFKSRGDELRSKLRGLGMDEPEAAEYEEQLDRGLLLVVATSEAADKSHDKIRTMNDRNNNSVL